MPNRKQEKQTSEKEREIAKQEKKE